MLNLLIELLWLAGKICLVIVVAYALLIVYLHYRAVWHMNFYEKQGAVLYPGCKSFFLGNMWDMVEYQKAYFGEEPIPGPQQWIGLEYFMTKMGYPPEEKFDGKKYPIMALNFQTVPHVWVSDPEIAQDIFVNKNSLTDKDGESLIMFEDIIGQSFVFAHNDDAWKTKRKACAHAFYKDRLAFMLETLKDKTATTFVQWAEKINQSKEKFHDFNMATEFSEILARNIIHVSFGEDLSDESITLQVHDGSKYVPKTMTVKEAIYVIID